MAEDKPNPEPSTEDMQTPIDPNQAAEAVKEVQEAMAILPKRRFGCLGRFGKYAVVLLLLFAVFIYWNFLRTPGLVISKETTYITEPLTADGTRVDYFAAIEKELYPPQMKTDDNGYRVIVRRLGVAKEFRLDMQGNQIKLDTEANAAAVYKKLGLDPAIEPDMTCMEVSEFLQEYYSTEELNDEQTEVWYRTSQPWTFDDLPMLEPWLEKNGPAIDLLSEAVRKPAFCIPWVRLNEDENAPLFESVSLGGIVRTRTFARMFQVRAYYRIGTGDIDGAIDDVVACAHLGRHLHHQGTLVSRLVGIAIEGIAASVGVAGGTSQPTEEQLQRLVDELNALPPRPDMDPVSLVERYYQLDWIQALAVGKESLGEAFSSLGSPAIEKHKPPFAEYVSVDWNVVLRQVNLLHEDLYATYVWEQPKVLSPGNLFIGIRSRRVAEAVALLSTPSFEATREASRRLNCVDNLKRITLAMLIYERQHGALPPAYTVDADGTPLHSWRVLLLPYLGEEKLHAKLHLDEPWDSEHNRTFHHAAPPIYQCPSAALPLDRTTYSVIVGEKTAFQAAKGKSLADFGMNLILVAELEKSVCWMDPTSDLTEVVASQGVNLRDDTTDGLGSPHPGGMNVGLRTAGVRFISETIASDVLRGLLDGTAEEPF